MNPAKLFHLALAHQREGRLNDAQLLFEQILKTQPNHPGIADVHFELGNIAAASDRPAAAVDSYRRAIAQRPDFPQALNNLANVLQDMGDLPQAISACRQAIALQPAWPELHSTLGNLLKELGDLNAAMACFEQALSLRPDFPDALNNLANIYQETGALDEAITLFQRVIAPQPDLSEAHYNLGNALRETGRIAQSLESFDRALRLAPENSIARSNRIYAMHFDPRFDNRTICDELSRWNQMHAAPLAKFIKPHLNDRDPDRPLRIGYVSPDFREHVVGWNLLPLLSNHDHQQFKIYCYASIPRPDAMTEKLKSHADVWRDILRLSNDQAADIIRQDRIDILVDLSLHSGHNRLLLFAQKPAPLQVTYLGYCGSTGLTAIDYRFSDPYLDPIGGPEEYAEKTIRLPHTYWCYQPGRHAPEIGPMPARTNKFITFGCLNNFSKISDPAIQLWAKILAAIPNSRLLLHAPQGAHRQRVLDHISAHRVEFIPKQMPDVYLQTYQRIDIALDPFPYGGGITTCDALYMGVPVVTLEGKTAVGRGAKSILCNAGLPNLVAQTPEEYQQIAISVSTKLSALEMLRDSLRGRMHASAIMNAPQFAKDVEAAYRKIWTNWCALADHF